MKHLQLWLILLCFQYSTGFLDPVTAGVAIATAGAAGSLFAHQYCKWRECCTDDWVRHNVSAIKTELKRNLFGQHIVKKIVAKAIKSHVNDANPKKPLVLSFHGTPGTGKNYVSDIIAKSLYKNGLDSSYVHKYVATKDFTNLNLVEEYKVQIGNKVEKEVGSCERSLFIFDEIDKLPENVSSVLRPFMDYHEKLNGVDYRKSIFIFLGNIAGQKLYNYSVQNFEKGKSREDISIRDMDRFLSVGAFNAYGGLHEADIIKAGLIDFFVPFLPLERKHVKMCVEAEIIRKNITFPEAESKEEEEKLKEELKEQVAGELNYFPEDSQLFSANGCKRVSKKLEVYT